MSLGSSKSSKSAKSGATDDDADLERRRLRKALRMHQRQLEAQADQSAAPTPGYFEPPGKQRKPNRTFGQLLPQRHYSPAAESKRRPVNREASLGGYHKFLVSLAGGGGC